MSVGFNPKNEQTMQQSLKVQEVSISGSDATLFQISGGNTFVMVQEPVDKVYLARVKVDSGNTWTEFAQSSLSIVGSTTLTTAAPNNKGAIKITGLSALATGDCLIVKYSVLEHL